MEDDKKTKKRLIAELHELRECVAELKDFEEEIKQTRVDHEKFTKAFLQNSIPMTITTAKEGRFFDVSDAFLRLIGLKRHEVIGHTTREAGFITEAQRALFHSELSKYGCIENFEMEIRSRSGVLRYVLFNAVMMSVNSENYLLTTIQDITERKQMEEALRIQHNLVLTLTTCHTVKEALEHILYAALQDKGLDSGAIYLTDPVTGNMNLSVTCGLSPEMVEHTSHLAADSPQVKRAKTNTPFYGRYPDIRPPGRDEIRDREGLTALASIPVLHKGNLVAIMNMASHVHDDIPIHTRHLLEVLAAQVGGVLVYIHSEEALLTQNETFSQVLNGLDALVYVVDMKTYEILFLNTYGQNIWGDIKGKICWQTIQAGQTGPCEYCTNSKLSRPDGKPAEGVIWEFQNTVNKRWYECRDRAICWPDDRIVRMEIATDITARKQTEEKVMTALKEKELLLQEVHHRVKNNMQVISSLLYLQASSSGNPEIAAMCHDIQKRIQSMALIHEKLYKAGDFTRIDMADYIRGLAGELIKVYALNPAIIDLIIEANDIYIDIKRAIPCGLIMNELISNALKHAFPLDQVGELRIMITEKKNIEMQIVVRDNGLGLPDNVDPHQPKGIGFYLVNGLVINQLGGQWEVARNNGTEIRIKFPV